MKTTTKHRQRDINVKRGGQRWREGDGRLQGHKAGVMIGPVDHLYPHCSSNNMIHDRKKTPQCFCEPRNTHHTCDLQDTSVMWLALWVASVIARRYRQTGRVSVNLAAWGASMHQDAAPVRASTWWSPRPFQACLSRPQSLANLSKLYSWFEIL